VVVAHPWSLTHVPFWTLWSPCFANNHGLVASTGSRRLTHMLQSRSSRVGLDRTLIREALAFCTHACTRSAAGVRSVIGCCYGLANETRQCVQAIILAGIGCLSRDLTCPCHRCMSRLCVHFYQISKQASMMMGSGYSPRQTQVILREVTDVAHESCSFASEQTRANSRDAPQA
jgi:hypothetical protein